MGKIQTVGFQLNSQDSKTFQGWETRGYSRRLRRGNEGVLFSARRDPRRRKETILVAVIQRNSENGKRNRLRRKAREKKKTKRKRLHGQKIRSTPIPRIKGSSTQQPVKQAKLRKKTGAALPRFKKWGRRGPT